MRVSEPERRKDEEGREIEQGQTARDKKKMANNGLERAFRPWARAHTELEDMRNLHRGQGIRTLG